MKGFDQFQALRKAGFTPKDLGIACSSGDINRLYARVKVARAFRGIQLEGFAPRTASGYDHLLRVFLAYSGFELWLSLVKCEFYNLEKDYPHYPYQELAAKIRKADRGERFWSFIAARTNSRLTKRMEDFRDGRTHNPAVLATGVRHVFAHGYLSANANEVGAATVRKTCQLLADFLLAFIDQEFSALVTPVYQREIKT